MSSTDTTPTVAIIPGATPNDGHEHFASPRNIIAFAIVAAFIIYSFLPFFMTVDQGRTGDMIANNGKVIETIVVLIIGFFFGTTVSASRKDATIHSQAKAAEMAVPSGNQSIVVEPPAQIDIKEPSDGPSADAARAPAPAPELPAAEGVRPGERE